MSSSTLGSAQAVEKYKDFFSLKSLVSPERRPVVVTIVGEGGLGKTTLASMFPHPVIIRTEAGEQAISHRKDVALFPLADKSKDVLDALETLCTQEHNFKTVVIDTITQLNVIIEREVVAADPKAKSINQAGGGYGAGHGQVAGRHMEVRDAAEKLVVERKMNVVFLAHADLENIDLPDQDQFMRYTVRLNKKSISHYTDNVDIVAMLKLKTYTTGDGDKKKAIGDGTRIITCYPTPSHISKNRFGITQDLVFSLDKFPFEACI